MKAVIVVFIVLCMTFEIGSNKCKLKNLCKNEAISCDFGKFRFVGERCGDLEIPLKRKQFKCPKVTCPGGANVTI